MSSSAANQNGGIPWVQYETKSPRSRNSSLASIASMTSLSSMGRRLSEFWRPNANMRDLQRSQSVCVANLPLVEEKRYMHVPVHAAASHVKTTSTPQSRKASMCPPPPPPVRTVSLGSLTR